MPFCGCLRLLLAQSNSELQIATGKDGWKLNRILGGLTSKGFLISHPNGRWTTYEPNAEYESSKEINKEINKEKLNEIPFDIRNKLTSTQIDMLSLILNTPSITLKQISEETGVSVQAIRTTRLKLRNMGININHTGSTKSGQWKIKFKQ